MVQMHMHYFSEQAVTAMTVPHQALLERIDSCLCTSMRPMQCLQINLSHVLHIADFNPLCRQDKQQPLVMQCVFIEMAT